MDLGNGEAACVSWAERTYFWERLEGIEYGLPGFQGLESVLWCQLGPLR